MLKRKLLSIVFVLTILLAACCGDKFDAEDSGEGENCNITKSDCKHDVISFILLADSNLIEDSKIAIMDALAEWDIKVGNRIAYTVKFQNMNLEESDPAKFENTYKLYIKDPGPGALGWTTWYASRNSAVIHMKPSLDKETFRVVLLHELGHAFDLHFGPPEKRDTHYTGELKSIMHPAIGNTNKLECTDILAFCERYNCQVDCIHELANPIYLQSSQTAEKSCETRAADLTDK